MAEYCGDETPESFAEGKKFIPLSTGHSCTAREREFKERVLDVLRQPLAARRIEVLQVNLGPGCNMACKHCHVGGGPARKEQMSLPTVEKVLSVLKENPIPVLDITGGAPELNPHFRYLVEEAGTAGIHVIVRTNLTIFFEEGMEYLPGFFAEHSVEVIASLPCYLAENVDMVRGKGAFGRSTAALLKLAARGYGQGSPARKLDLVYNPSGAFLPPVQGVIEADYRKELKERFGISFDRLFTFANMPVGRFREFLERTDRLENYMVVLSDAFNPRTLDGVMCRYMINVGWNGLLYDCDFNQALGLNIGGGGPVWIEEFDIGKLSGREIAVGNHCYGCTAGQGST